MSLVDDLLAHGDFAAAERRCSKALKRVPDKPSTSFSLGRLALSSNQLDQAERFLSAALAGRHRAKVAHLLAETFYRLDEFDQAAAWFRIAGRKAMARKLEGFHGTVPYRMDKRVGTHLRLVPTDPLPVVRLRINHGAEGYFLIDTGGSELMLDREFGRRGGAVE